MSDLTPDQELAAEVLSFLEDRWNGNPGESLYEDAIRLIRRAYFLSDTEDLDAKHIACPICGAPRGKPCHRDDGTTCQPHEERGERWFNQRRRQAAAELKQILRELE